MSNRLARCAHGGGPACTRQGGSGTCQHAAGYLHPLPTVAELGAPVGDVTSLKQEISKSIELPELTTTYDADALTVLSTGFDTSVDSVGLVAKSLYSFDVETPEGVMKILELIPVLDADIIRALAGKIWPGYPTADRDINLLRDEVRGYLMDLLNAQ